MKRKSSHTSSRKRLIISAVLGLTVGCVVAAVWRFSLAPLLAWDMSALTYVVSTMVSVWKMNATETRAHALREDPGQGMADLLLLVTSLASIAAVGVLVFQANSAEGIEKGVDIVLGLVSVVLSWSTVHTVYLLRYARLYFSEPEGGIDFNEQAKPRYSDFAYLAYTVGMTFQVSDTDLQTKVIRSTVLKHAVLAYLFGTVIVATTINAVVTISSS